MSTITASYSLDQATYDGIVELANERRFSRSDAVRELFRRYKDKNDFRKIQAEFAPLARGIGIESEDDVERIFG
jgi:Arc/MetJ-type ribon-helix-helix transcriptional regulator